MTAGRNPEWRDVSELREALGRNRGGHSPVDAIVDLLDVSARLPQRAARVLTEPRTVQPGEFCPLDGCGAEGRLHTHERGVAQGEPRAGRDLTAQDVRRAPAENGAAGVADYLNRIARPSAGQGAAPDDATTTETTTRTSAWKADER